MLPFKPWSGKHASAPIGILFPSFLYITLSFLSTSTLGQKSGQIEFHIKEQQSSGTEVGSVQRKARIAQSVPTSEINSLKYGFLKQNDPQQTTSLFSINSDTGTIYTTAMIDRESVCELRKDCSVEFEVTVTSSASNLFKMVEVRIVIEDINDNSPRFPRDEVTLFVEESFNVNRELSIDGATDKDTDGDNSVHRYRMKTDYPDVFGLSSEQKLDGTWDLKIVLLKRLDRETMDHYTLYVIASDNGIPRRSGSVTVHIKVGDDNDNKPVFSKNIYSLEVNEKAQIGSVVGQVTATDADINSNADIRYDFSKAKSADIKELFYIDSLSGEIKVKKELQYESGRKFETVVEAADLGNPPQEAQTILIISILDVGNTPPRISVSTVPNSQDGILTIKEDIAIDTVVANVKTSDRDQGQNGIVDCYSVSHYFKTRLFEDKGFLVEVARDLDRESQAEINITIICKDRGEPQLNDTAWFIIRLLDVNDKRPKFSKQIYQASITENNRRGAHVVNVSATDEDLGKNAALRYSISMKSAESSFMINERTGEITAGESFDRETLSQVSFMVKVVDMGSPPMTGEASVVVNILDVNDQPPYFTSSMEFEIAEKLPFSSVVGKLEGADKDHGKNAAISFHIPQNEINVLGDQVPFLVFKDGMIKTDRILHKDMQERYKFPVVVADKGIPSRSSTATVTIRVIDSNEYIPRFLYPSRDNSSVHISSNARIGTVVTVLKAMDDDFGRNGRLTYSINDLTNDLPFSIQNEKNGEIVLVRELVLSESSIFRLNVSVRDQGIPVHTSHAVLTIYVDYEDGMPHGRSGTPENTSAARRSTDIKYIIIAGVVGGITVVISIIIVVIIFLIRRPDRNNRTPPPAGVQEQGDERHFDKQMWQSVPVDDISPTRDIPEKKLGDVEMNGDTGYPEKPSNGGLSPKSTRDLIDPYGRKHTSDIFQAQPQLYTFKKCAVRAPTDDFQSDASGETTTSDSGRGGSEEDIQLPPLPELCEDTSRIIFKNPGSGLKDSRFVQPTYPGHGSGEIISFQTFSPRTLPSSHGSDRRDPNVSHFSARDTQTLAPATKPKPTGGAVDPTGQRLTFLGGGQTTRNILPGGNKSGGPLSTNASPNQYRIQSPSPSHQQHPPQQHRDTVGGKVGPGHYPRDIPERMENPYGKKVTFQTDLTTQNLKTWDLCQKMNIQPEAAVRNGLHGDSRGGPRSTYSGRPRSQDDDDNTTTSGSYTINPDNDFDDGLPPTLSSVA